MVEARADCWGPGCPSDLPLPVSTPSFPGQRRGEVHTFLTSRGPDLSWAPWEVVCCRGMGGLAPQVLREMGESWDSPPVTFTGIKFPFLQKTGKPLAFENQ